MKSSEVECECMRRRTADCHQSDRLLKVWYFCYGRSLIPPNDSSFNVPKRELYHVVLISDEPLRISSVSVMPKCPTHHSSLQFRAPFPARWIYIADDSQQGWNNCKVLLRFSMASWMMTKLHDESSVKLNQINSAWFSAKNFGDSSQWVDLVTHFN